MIIEDSLESIPPISEENPMTQTSHTHEELQSPKIEPSEMNFSDIRTVRQKMFEAEDQKNKF